MEGGFMNTLDDKQIAALNKYAEGKKFEPLKPLKEYDEENIKNGRPNKKTISLTITEKPVYYLFTTKKDSDIAVSKTISIKVKLFPLTIKGKKINKRQKYYEIDNDLETAIENGEVDEDHYMMLEKSILYDDTGMNNFAELTDGHHRAQTHFFIKICDKKQVYSVLYYLNNNRRLYRKIKDSKDRTFCLKKQKDFIDFFRLAKKGYLQKKSSILPVIPYKYETMRELLEAEGDTKKITRLDNHKEASRAYRERQAEIEDKERAEGKKPVLIHRKRRKYNKPIKTRKNN
jgi:hypothetical protein